MKKKFAVLGDPVEHSWSPLIHNSFAKQFNLSLEYKKIKVTSGSLNSALNDLVANNYLGFNITVPLKQEAFRLAMEKKWDISSRALKAGAINTLSLRKNFFFADNTDGFGLLRDLHRQGFSEKNASILIIGAGGAVRGILPMFLENNPNKVIVVNRTEYNLQLLSKIFENDFFEYLNINDFNKKFSKYDHGQVGFETFDLIINATSASISDQRLEITRKVFLKCPLVVDLYYSLNPTPFLNLALSSGAKKAIDGLGMLVEQAAESFYIWTNNRPRTKEVMNKIRSDVEYK